MTLSQAVTGALNIVLLYSHAILNFVAKTSSKFGSFWWIYSSPFNIYIYIFLHTTLFPCSVLYWWVTHSARRELNSVTWSISITDQKSNAILINRQNSLSRELTVQDDELRFTLQNIGGRCTESGLKTPLTEITMVRQRIYASLY